MNEGILIGIAGLVAGFVIAFWVRGKIGSQKLKAAEQDAASIIEEARRKAEGLLKSADVEMKETLFKLRSDFDHEVKENQSEFKKREMRLVQREEGVEPRYGFERRTGAAGERTQRHISRNAAEVIPGQKAPTEPA